MTQQLTLNLSAENTLCEGLNEAQREAVMAPMNSALQVMAGAGTGKTELITRRFAKLALDLSFDFDREPSERIWVSTFTDKAAQEMRERIAKYLHRCSGMSLHPRAWIGTFHSLCNRILQQHQDKVPYLEGFTLLSDIELDLIQEQLVASLLMGHPEGLEKILNSEGVVCSPTCLDTDRLFQLDLGDFERFFNEVVFTVIPKIKASGLSPKAFHKIARQQAESYANLIMTLPAYDGTTGMILGDHDAYARFWTRHLEPVSHKGFSFYPSDWELEIESSKAQSKGKEAPDTLHLLRDTLKPFYKTGCFVTYNGRKKKGSLLNPDK